MSCLVVEPVEDIGDVGGALIDDECPEGVGIVETGSNSIFEVIDDG